ncbi:MAG: thioesterase family protein [Myxococcota bacterium]
MADLIRDTQVEPLGPGRYRAQLAEAWAFQGPMGGYLAGVALRAIAAESPQPRPASFTCQFLRAGRFGSVEIEVTRLRSSKRTDALRAELRQDGETLLCAQAWMVADGLQGLAHRGGQMPDVGRPAELDGFEDLMDNYDEWPPLWRSVRGKPSGWMTPEPREPICNFWMRLLETPTLPGPLDDAVRQLLWIDVPPWNAVVSAHGFPIRYMAPNLDLTVQFHQFAPEAEWVLCSGLSPHAGAGLAGSVSQLWTEDGRLLASGTAQLLCRPNPMYEEQLAVENQRAQERDPEGD